MNKPFISLIMPNFNNEHVLDLFFSKFIENNTYDNYEFIVTDDGSTDNSLSILKKWQKSNLIKNMTIFAERHKGIISALNKCLYASKGDFIIRLDGDATIETKSFIEKFLEFYYIDPEKIGVITTKVITDQGKLHAIGRNVISPNGLHDRGYIIKRTNGNISAVLDEKLNEYINIPAECDTALGVCTFSDKKTALKIGGFDYRYPLYMEDDDFYLGYRLYNKKCFYLPDIEICHRFSLRGSRKPKDTKIQKLKKFLTNILRTIYICLILNDVPVCVNLKPVKSKNSWKREIWNKDIKVWYKKWGFDCINPDMEYIKDRYKNTELIWNYNKTLKQKGIDIVNKYIQIKSEKYNDNNYTR